VSIGETLVVTIIGELKSAESYTLRDFLQRSGYPFEWIEVATDEEARRLAGVDSLDDPRLPVCKISDHEVLYRPSIQELAKALDWFSGPKLAEYDLAIYGAGPAGLSAAVYGASEGLTTVLIERSAVGGQAGTTSRIENYLGFPNGISGAELAGRAREQAVRLGAEILIADECVAGAIESGKTVGYLSDGAKIVSRASICATGIEYHKLGLAGEEHLLGRGLYYGAGSSEARLCRGHVFVVGGGNSAGQAAINFAKNAEQVTMLIRGESLKATLSQYLIDRIARTKNIEVCPRCTVTELHGGRSLEGITYHDANSGRDTRAATGWLFVCIGGSPRTDWNKQNVLLKDEAGYLLTGNDFVRDGKSMTPWPLPRLPYSMETSIPGVFAAGDVRHNSIKRCATAVGDGATAVAVVHRYLADGSA